MSEGKGKHIAPEKVGLSDKKAAKLAETITAYWDHEAQCTAISHRVVGLMDWDMMDHQRQIVALELAIHTDTHLMLNPGLPPGKILEYGDVTDMVAGAGYDSIEHAKAAYLAQIEDQRELRHERIEESVADFVEQLESGLAQAMLFGEGHSASPEVEVHVIEGRGYDAFQAALKNLADKIDAQRKAEHNDMDREEEE